ncbi:MAG: DUF2087 domain-containing protein [Cohnella sp.]|nr:DUF2087 domain-containing protein [Cohnella sp.]
MSIPITNTPSKDAHLQSSVLRNFFTEQGRLKSLPAQLKKKLIVLEHLAERMDPGKRYSESEMNAFIRAFHEDYATIRRELYVHRFVNRDREIYEVNAREEWRDWANLN